MGQDRQLAIKFSQIGHRLEKAVLVENRRTWFKAGRGRRILVHWVRECLIQRKDGDRRGGTGHGVHTGTTVVGQTPSPLVGFLDKSVSSNHGGARLAVDCEQGGLARVPGSSRTPHT